MVLRGSARLVGVVAVVGSLLAALLLSPAPASAAPSAAPSDPRGTWTVVSHCTSGWCRGQDFPNVWTISTWNRRSGAVTGTDTTGTLAGGFSGGTLRITGTAGGYTARAVAHLSGTRVSGSWTDSNDAAGTLTGTFTPTRTPRASRTQLSCDLLLANTSFPYFACTVVVGDASGEVPAERPTGTVAVTVDPGGPGAVAGGCTLVPSGTGGPTSFCGVTYNTGGVTIPVGTQPPLTATYSGDDAFDPSTGRPTSVYVTSEAAEAYNQSAADCLTAASAVPATLRAHRLVTPPTNWQVHPANGAVSNCMNAVVFPFRVVGAGATGIAWGVSRAVQYGGRPIGNTAMGAGGVLLVPAAIAGAAGAEPVAAGLGGAGLALLAGGLALRGGAEVASVVGDGAESVTRDPPDPDFQSLPVVDPITRPRPPKGFGATGRHWVQWNVAARQTAAYMAALTSAIDKAGGARAAGDSAWIGRQTQAALRFASSARGALVRWQAANVTITRDLRRAARGVEPVTRAQIAAARRFWRQPPARVRAAVAAVGGTVAEVRRAVARVRPGARVEVAALPSPYLSGLIDYALVMCTGYPLLPEVQADAALT